MQDARRFTFIIFLLIALTACAPAAPAAQQIAPTDVPTPQSTAAAAPTAPPSEVPTLAPTEAPTAMPTQAFAAEPPPPQAQDAVAPAPPDAAQGQPTDQACPTASAPLPPRGSPGAQDFFRSFRQPLPPAPLYDPPGQKRVGLQVGHWQLDQVPPELHGLQAGANGGGKQEWQVNLDVAQRTAALLEADGIEADVLPATVPEHYRANAFLAIHADGDTTGQTRGFKVARPGFSSVPDIDDRFVQSLEDAYGQMTNLPRDDEHISLRMRYYYAFNSRRYCHAVAPGVPQAIIEMAYLTSATDRQYLIGSPQLLARGITEGLETFLSTLP
jgi:N-acetylmuramoyl-L-alanine amidase